MRSGLAGPGSTIWPRRHALEAEAGVVGLVADQDHDGDAGGARVLKRLADQPAPVALVGEIGLDGQRAEQECAALAADPNRA